MWQHIFSATSFDFYEDGQFFYDHKKATNVAKRTFLISNIISLKGIYYSLLIEEICKLWIVPKKKKIEEGLFGFPKNKMDHLIIVN